MNMPPGKTEILTKKALFYRTMNCVNKRIENAPTHEVDDALANMAEKIKFINKTKLFGTIEVHFIDEETAREYLLKNIKTEK